MVALTGTGGSGGDGGRGGGLGGLGGDGGVGPRLISTATELPSSQGKAGTEKEMLIEASAGKQTSRLEVQGPMP
jgi:hypothetical protein